MTDSSASNALFRESIRSLRTNLLIAAKRDAKSFAVVSAGPKEGKSTLAIHLACSLASLAKRVLLIDADLRKPTVHTVMPLKNDLGLTDVLRGEISVHSALQTVGDFLSVLTAGAVPPDPQQMLESEATPNLIEYLKTHYDFLIFDTAPLLAVADTPLLASHLDGAIFVIRSGVSMQKDVLGARERLVSIGLNIVGCVFNGSEDSTTGSNYPYMKDYAPVESITPASAPTGRLMVAAGNERGKS